MKMNPILIFRKLHANSFVVIRKLHMASFVKKQKKSYTKKWVLTKQQAKAAKEYYRDYESINPLFHNYYTEKNGVFDPRYIPDPIYYNRINLFYNAHQMAKVIDNKCYYDVLFPDIPQPEVVARRRGGYWFIGRQLVDENALLAEIAKDPEVFVKRAVDCGGGHGVHCVTVDDAGAYKDQLRGIFKAWGEDIVIQKSIKQHSALGSLNSSSVNTMRILTVLRKGQVKVYSSLLRIGGGKGRVDNFCSGGVSVGIADDGKLKAYGYYANGDRITTHPATGVAFDGYQLPSFEAAKELVKKAHYYVPDFKMVSWDVAICEDGSPILIETNLSDGQLDLHQLSNGPLFGEDTKEILNEVFGK